MKREIKRRKGFTLIELVIVIVIIGVLAGIAALSYANVTQSSQDGVAKANLRAMKSSVMVYQADNAGKFPPATDTLPAGFTEPAVPAGQKVAKTKNLGNLKPYLETQAYRNPSDAYTYTYTLSPDGKTATLKVEGGKLKGTKEGEDLYTILNTK
ncbi:MAG: prepilin-type N-terminal cleavage/methylation domain-containing protein [Bacillota bacterium]|nr:prepilin-type N-terminal cleavage/methylation domain-containing protein [Bacillota bacterium]